MAISKRVIFYSSILVLILLWVSSIFSIHHNLRIVSVETVQHNEKGINFTFLFKNSGLYPIYVTARASVYSETGENLGNFIIVFGFAKSRSVRNQSVILDIEPTSEMDLVLKIYYEAKLFFLPGIKIPLTKKFHVSLSG